MVRVKERGEGEGKKGTPLFVSQRLDCHHVITNKYRKK